LAGALWFLSSSALFRATILLSPGGVDADERASLNDLLTLAKRQRWTVTTLVKLCPEIATPTAYFREVFSGSYPNKLIVYRSVLRLYLNHTLPKFSFEDAELSYHVPADPLHLQQPPRVHIQSTKGIRACPCGCGIGLGKGQQTASAVCRRQLSSRNRQLGAKSHSETQLAA
jgi:hypothetical protein